MRNILLIIMLLCSQVSGRAQNFNFNGTMSNEQLDAYMSRSMQMANLNEDRFGNFATTPWTPPPFGNTNIYNAEVDMLRDMNVRLIGRVALLWGGESVINGTFFNDVGTVVNDINTHYDLAGLVRPICQAGIMEIVTNEVNNIAIPANIATLFGVSGGRNFNKTAMMYPSVGFTPAERLWDVNNPNGDIIPDISQVETQMYFYFLARNYIEQGIEALHMGQWGMMDRNDPGHTESWKLLSMIRDMAAANAPRALVLIDAHTTLDANGNVQPNFYTHNSLTSQNDQLLFDYLSAPTRATNVLPAWTPTVNNVPAFIQENDCGTPYGKITGGRMPLGWYAARQPYFIEMDNTRIDNPTTGVVDCWDVWGRDELGWFEAQTANYQNDWLVYAYYKAKCLDDKAYYQILGKKFGFRVVNNLNQRNIIEDIWDGNLTGDDNWVQHIFTDREVLNPPVIPHVDKSLITVGDDKMFYIADDGYIFGYIKDNGATGTWRTVSPNWEAHFGQGQNINTQVKAASDLVASPDGTKLLYIGVDGYVHGFNITGAWGYQYFTLLQSSMQQQNIIAESNLIFATNERVYYIAKEGSGLRAVHGFILNNGNWSTVSPAHASQLPSSLMNVPKFLYNALAYDDVKHRLYYVDVNNMLDYYDVLNDWSYTYYEVPSSLFNLYHLDITSKQLAIDGDRIYCAAENNFAQPAYRRVYAFYEVNGQWDVLDVTNTTTQNNQALNAQEIPSNKGIAVSPDGEKVAYIGLDGLVYYYKDINQGLAYSYNPTVRYSFNTFAINATQLAPYEAENSLQYYDDNTLFYNSSGSVGDEKVHWVKFEESFCENNSIDVIEANFRQSFYKPGRPPVKETRSLELNEVDYNKDIMPWVGGELSIYPNPASDILYVNGITNSAKVQVVNYVGQVVYTGNIESVSSKINIDKLSSGIYILKIIGKNGFVETRKIVKE